MIIVKLLGGLGNQMFQYAAARAVANRLNEELLLDITAFAHYELRRFELEDWAITARVASPVELSKFGVLHSRRTVVHRFAERLGLRRPLHRFKERTFTFDARIDHLKAPVYLEGYWQSEQYFSNIAVLLRQEFALKKEPDLGNRSMAALISDAGQRAVSLHIRRGDYVSNPHTASYHGVCSLSYYNSAAKLIAEKVSNPHFFVFSDDLQWSRENLRLEHMVTFVDVNGADKGAYDMALMFACKHHIVANSSFSWWGAWLNPYNDKIVIAPKQWFGGANHDTSDLLPSSWILL